MLLPTPVVADTLGTTLIVANNLAVGSSSTFNSQGGQINSLLLGTGLTTLNTNNINVGTGSRDVGQITFGQIGGDLIIRGADGVSRANAINIGTGTATTGVGNVSVNNLVDFSGHDADILVETLNVGSQARAANLTSTFNFGSGDSSIASVLDATSVNIGFRTGTNSTNSALTNVVNLSGGTVTFGNIGATGTGVTIGSNTNTTGNTASVSGALNISGGNVTIFSGNAGYAVQLGQNVVAGGVTVSSAMNLTGGSTIVAGNIVRNAVSPRTTSSLTLNGASATLDMIGNNITDLTSITYTDGLLKNLGVVNTGMTLAGSGSRVFQQDAAYTLGDIQGVIAGPGVGLTKEGSGNLTLSGANTYTGDTTVNAGVLRLAGGSAIADTGLVSIANVAGATLQLDASETIATLNGGGATGGTVNLAAGDLTVGSGTFSGAITGSGALNKSGAGTLTLDGSVANTFSGLTTVSGGLLALNKTPGTNAIVGDGVSSKFIPDVMINGGTVRLDGNNQLDDSVFVTINAGGTFNRNGKSDTIFNFVNNGGTYLSGRGGTFTVIDPDWIAGSNDILGAEIYGVLNVSGGTNTIHGDELSGFGAGSVTVGAGGLNFSGTASPTITVSSDNTAAGSLILNGDVTSSVSAGTASIAAGNQLTDLGGPGPWVNTGSPGSNLGTLDLGGATRSFNILNGSADADMSISTVIINGGLDKTGSGALLITGNNTYTGPTNVSGGTLINNGSIANSSVTVSGPGTLSGTGTIAGATVIDGTHTVGTDSTGSGAATTSFGNNLTYNSGSTFVWDLVGDSTTPGTFDTVVNTAGTLNIGPGVNTTLRLGSSDFSQAFWSNNQTWLVFSGATGGSGFFDTGLINVDTTGSINGPLVGTWAWSRTGNDVFLNFTAVPEPASLGGALVLLGSWFARRRNKRKNVNA